MGLQHREYLSGSRVFGCSKCRTHLATTDNMISRQFNGQHGRAYLFETAVNIKLGEAEDRPMTTGLHTVRDIYCGKCGTTIGWKYDKAYEPTQKYKEGKVILEKALLVDVH
ncbi:Yippee/Mis18 [Melampsora americana]|nr:Yippee/Mis18 [Melampsora americana]KAH9824878.1 Yippee/Mis18 [Melampsora americana]